MYVPTKAHNRSLGLNRFKNNVVRIISNHVFWSGNNNCSTYITKYTISQYLYTLGLGVRLEHLDYTL